MTGAKLIAGLVAMAGFLTVAHAQGNPGEDLILCDCGIGDNKQHTSWSTSRQMNWYSSLTWPNSAYTYPQAPDMAVQVPYRNGIYPWVPGGATGTMPNGDVWTAYIQDGTPDGFKSGTAVTTKDGGETLNCWAYRGRPISAALNTTANTDAICWSAFVCNHDSSPPPRPSDMGSQTSTLTTSSAAPATSVFSETPETPTPTSGGQPAPKVGSLFITASVSPRFLNWPSNWQSFINDFIWDQNTGKCTGPPIVGSAYTITVDCQGVPVGTDSHMTLLLLEALRDVGMKSLWFNQSPVIPGGTSSNGTSPSWVVMPESFTLQATDEATNDVVGYITYSTKYNTFLSGPCSTCQTSRFDSNFFDPIIAAMQGSYPTYNSFTIQANCDPWMVC